MQIMIEGEELSTFHKTVRNITLLLSTLYWGWNLILFTTALHQTKRKMKRQKAALRNRSLFYFFISFSFPFLLLLLLLLLFLFFFFFLHLLLLPPPPPCYCCCCSSRFIYVSIILSWVIQANNISVLCNKQLQDFFWLIVIVIYWNRLDHSVHERCLPS